MRMMQRHFGVLLFVTHACAGNAQLASFDSASASSTYSSDNLAGSPGFAAQQATGAGSGYWCSSGQHGAGQSVTWTGVLNVRRQAVGVKINWAYGPGQMKILGSADGANFKEILCWRTSRRTEVSYEESIMFDTPENIKALTIVMRGPLAWGYYGITDVELIAEPAPFMLISGKTSASGELCVVVEDEAVFVDGAELAIAPCLSAIAAGDGREVFHWGEDGQIVNTVGDKCVTLTDGETAGGGKLVMRPCASSSEVGDGRSSWAFQPNAQIKLTRMGDFCLTMVGEAGTEQDATVGAQISASSSQPGHSVQNVADNDEGSFWASAFDATENAPVDIDISFGSTRYVTDIEISWEYPAKSFDVQVSSGGTWSGFLSTSNNNLNLTAINGQFVRGTKLRIRMREPHPVWGVLNGRALYGIKSIRAKAYTNRAIVRDCAEAGINEDARDKFFMTAVPEFDSSAVAGVKATAGLLVAAQQHLGALLARLHAQMPTLKQCGDAGVLFCEKAALVARHNPEFAKACSSMPNVSLASEVASRKRTFVLGLSASDPTTEAIKAINGNLRFDSDSLSALIATCRATSDSVLQQASHLLLSRLSDVIPHSHHTQ